MEYSSFAVDEGGLCAKYHEVKNKENQTEWQSHNTGVLNLAHNYRELPENVAKLAFVHEIGHSMGSKVSVITRV